MSNSLSQKAVNGVSWSFIDNISNQGITFLIGLILARLLTPQEYGLIGIITIFISISNSIVDSGFSSALVRKNNATDEDYNTVFISNLIVSVILAITIYILSPSIAVFFGQPHLNALMKVMSSIIIINAFAIIQRTLLIKRIDFKTQTKVSLISSISSGIVGIFMALKGLGAWSLVGQQVSRQSLNSIFLWIYAQWKPSLQFSILSFKELFNFGWKLLLSSLIDTLWKEGFQVVIGKCYSPATLGQYTRASQFSSICSTNITSIIQRVSYPVLSTIQDDKIKLKYGYKKIIKITMLISFTLMLGMAGAAKSMIQILIGDQWLPAVPFLQIICFSMMLYPLHALNLNMLQVQGRSDLFLKLEIIKKCIGIIPILLGIFINIYWMLISSVIVGFFSYYLNAYYSGSSLNYYIREQLKDILPSFTIAMTMGSIIYGISYLPLSPYIMFPSQLIIGFVITVLLCKITNLPEYHEIINIIITIYHRLKKQYQ